MEAVIGAKDGRKSKNAQKQPFSGVKMVFRAFLIKFLQKISRNNPCKL